jgi:hypothetical protein
MMSLRRTIGVVLMPTVIIGTWYFWTLRGFYPIKDRVPMYAAFVPFLASLTMIMPPYHMDVYMYVSNRISVMFGLCIAILNATYIVDEDEASHPMEPCPVAELAVTLYCIPLGLLTFTVRAFLLLFKFEITRDLEVNNLTRQSHASYLSSHATNQSTSDSPAPTNESNANNVPIGVSGSQQQYLVVDNNNTANNNHNNDRNTANNQSTPIGHLTTSGASESVGYRPLLSPTAQMINHVAPTLQKDESHQSHQWAHQPYQQQTSGNGRQIVSWYTRHHYLVRPRYTIGAAVIISIISAIIWMLTILSEGRDPCITADRTWHQLGLYWSGVISMVQVIILAVLARKLSRHGEAHISTSSIPLL